MIIALFPRVALGTQDSELRSQGSEVITAPTLRQSLKVSAGQGGITIDCCKFMEQELYLRVMLDREKLIRQRVKRSLRLRMQKSKLKTQN